MKPNLIISVLFILLLPLGISAAENETFSERTQRGQRESVQSTILPENGINNLAPQPNVSRRQASNIASSRYEGRVVGIRLENNSHWRVRMDNDGTVFNVFVNASSGDVNASYE